GRSVEPGARLHSKGRALPAARRPRRRHAGDGGERRADHHVGAGAPPPEGRVDAAHLARRRSQGRRRRLISSLPTVPFDDPFPRRTATPGALLPWFGELATNLPGLLRSYLPGQAIDPR